MRVESCGRMANINILSLPGSSHTEPARGRFKIGEF